MDHVVQLPGPANPPGAVQPYVEPVDGLTPDMVKRLTHDYLDSTKKVDDIAMDLGVSTKEVRSAIKKYGLDQRKHEIITQVQQEELAAYSQFLLDKRVDTAKQHLEISEKLNAAVNSILKEVADKPPEQLTESIIKPLKSLAGLYRSLGETLSSSSTVGARAVALTGLADSAGGLQLVGTAGKRPLVSMSFNVQQAPAAPPVCEVLEAEIIPET
jgi:DNA-binding transcriptional MerR regulator